MVAQCKHAYIVWDDGSTPVVELEEGEDEADVWVFINEDSDHRYAECDNCGKVLNA